MVLVDCTVKVDIVLAGSFVPMQQVFSTTAPASDQQTLYDAHKPRSTSLCAWMGGDNSNMFMREIDSTTGTTRLQIDVNENDLDTVKFTQTLDLVTACGNRPYVLASSWIPVEQLCNLLDGKEKCFCMSSNFDKNAVVMTFTNVGTDTKRLRALKLNASALRNMDKMNHFVQNLSQHLQNTVSSLEISPSIGATQFIPINTITYLPMQNVCSCYAVIPRLFSKIKNTPVTLPWLMYDMYQALHLTQFHPTLLQALPDADLITRFGCPMIQNRCNCALTSPYSEDLTSDQFGRATKGTEEISLTFSQMAFRAQQTQSDYSPPQFNKLHSAYLDQYISTLKEVQQENNQHLATAAIQGPVKMRKTIAACIDDCENGAQGFILQHKALKNLYEQINQDPRRLLSLIKETARQYPHLFANITPSVHESMAPVLFRLAKAAHEKTWETSMTVVTARNRAMEAVASATGVQQLAGHGVCMGRVTTASNEYVYPPMEATTSMKVQPAKQHLQRKADIVCKMLDGSLKTFSLSEYATILAQNVHHMLSISPFSLIQANISDSVEYKNDWTKSPFYVGAFYTGFVMHSNSLGCIPCTNTKQTASFGAPVPHLNCEQTCALPIPMLDTDMDKYEFDQFLTSLSTEVWPPAASKDDIDKMLAMLAPVDPLPLSSMLTEKNYKQHLTTLISCAYDDPAHRHIARFVLSKLAERFNQLQEKAAQNDDGHRLHVNGNYHSATINIIIDLNKDGETMKSSTIKNLQQAINDTGMQTLVQCPFKEQKIERQMQLESIHPFYLCDQGNGIVHSFAHQLA
jgi:hypothetical protein